MQWNRSEVGKNTICFHGYNQVLGEVVNLIYLVITVLLVYEVNF